MPGIHNIKIHLHVFFTYEDKEELKKRKREQNKRKIKHIPYTSRL
jgi:hypothetical protein